jgi:hypothetical protein
MFAGSAIRFVPSKIVGDKTQQFEHPRNRVFSWDMESTPDAYMMGHIWLHTRVSSQP